ncbi:MAG: hypothetical protein JO147_00885 [Actinobacteria bacterium]|nr:hypothetical protein [Actinomycetota bacterium]
MARTYLDDLREATGQNVHLAVRDGTTAIYVDALGGAGRRHRRANARWPLQMTAAGLVLLAHAPAGILDQVLAGPLAVFTDRTLRRPEVVRRVLADVRRAGIVVSVDRCESVDARSPRPCMTETASWRPFPYPDPAASPAARPARRAGHQPCGSPLHGISRALGGSRRARAAGVHSTATAS